MAKVDRSILAANDQSMGQFGDPDKLEASISHLADKIDVNDNDTEILKTDNTSNKGRLTELENDVSTLESADASNKNRIANLETDNSSNKTRISNLETDNVSNKGKIATNENNIAYNEGRLTELLRNTEQASEVVDARMGFPVLRNKLEDVDAQLAERAEMAHVLLTVKWYGAIGDGASHPISEKYNTLADAQVIYPHATSLTDEIDWCAIQKAINQDKQVLLPSGSFRVNKTVDARKNLLHLSGSGGGTEIFTTVDNIPILQIGGYKQKFNGFKLRYSNVQDNTKTNANAIEIHRLFESEINGLEITNSYRGMCIPQVLVNNQANIIYSCTLSNIRISRYSAYGIHLAAYNGGNTGNILSNIYIVNKDDAENRQLAINGIYLQTWNEGILQQINIEHGKFNAAIVLNDCPMTTLQSVHFEGVEPTGNYSALIDILGARSFVSVKGITIIYSHFLSANLPNNYAIFRIADLTNLLIEGISEEANTISVPTFVLVYGNPITSATVKAVNVRYNGLTGLTSLPSTQIPVLKQFNDRVYYHQNNNGRHIFYASAKPTSGNWTRGDRVMNSDVNELGTTGSKYILDGWECVTTGTPGTWVERRFPTGN